MGQLEVSNVDGQSKCLKLTYESQNISSYLTNYLPLTGKDPKAEEATFWEYEPRGGCNKSSRLCQRPTSRSFNLKQSFEDGRVMLFPPFIFSSQNNYPNRKIDNKKQKNTDSVFDKTRRHMQPHTHYMKNEVEETG